MARDTASIISSKVKYLRFSCAAATSHRNEMTFILQQKSPGDGGPDVMKTGFSKYDIADNLKTEEQAVLFLEACFDEAGDDAAFIAAALGEIARAHGMTEIANATGLTREGLYKTLSKDGNPSFAAILKVMKALGLKLKPEVA
jgi:probable addiction module antidote protein